MKKNILFQFLWYMVNHHSAILLHSHICNTVNLFQTSSVGNIGQGKYCQYVSGWQWEISQGSDKWWSPIILHVPDELIIHILNIAWVDFVRGFIQECFFKRCYYSSNQFRIYPWNPKSKLKKSIHVRAQFSKFPYVINFMEYC